VRLYYRLRVTHEPPAAVLGEFGENLRLVRLGQDDLEAPRSWGDFAPVRAIYVFDHIAAHAGQIITTRKLWKAFDSRLYPPRL